MASIIQMRRDTKANWILNNPIPHDGEPCVETDTKLLKIGDGITNYVDLAGISGGGSGGDVLKIGDFKFAATSGDRTSEGLVQFAFDNAISQANYPALYSKIGDMFEMQHTDAGDSASGSGMFYPTPVPGAYGRVGIPDMSFTDSDVSDSAGNIRIDGTNIHSTQRFGTAFVFEVITGTPPAGLVNGTTYYGAFGEDYLLLHSTEADAVAITNRIPYTDSGSGTFRLTQEGIVLDDAFQGHKVGIIKGVDPLTSGNSSGRFLEAQYTTYTTVNSELPVTDGTNGTPRPTNETRPKTNYSFGYIKAEHVTSSGEPISALRYDTGWIQESTDWNNQTYTVSHGLSSNMALLICKLFISSDGTDATAMETSVSSGYSAIVAASYGAQFNQVDSNNINLITGSYSTGTEGLLYLNASGVYSVVPLNWYYKVVITKPNLINTVFDVSNLPKTYDLTSANETVTLPVISGVTQTKSIYWTNGVTYKLTLAVTDGATVGGLAATTWEGEGDGHISLESDGSNWQVREYEDHLINSTGEAYKEASGELTNIFYPILFTAEANSYPNAFGSTSGTTAYNTTAGGTFIIPFVDTNYAAKPILGSLAVGYGIQAVVDTSSAWKGLWTSRVTNVDYIMGCEATGRWRT